jgi:hypothetical protein
LGRQTADDYLMLERANLPPLSRNAVLDRADDWLPEYRRAITNVPPEAGFGGIWKSEMFLF